MEKQIIDPKSFETCFHCQHRGASGYTGSEREVSLLSLRPIHDDTGWERRWSPETIRYYVSESRKILTFRLSQYISEIVLSCWVQSSDSSASEYQTTGFSPFSGRDYVCNQLQKAYK